jgi:hypothetical protein
VSLLSGRGVFSFGGGVEEKAMPDHVPAVEPGEGGVHEVEDALFDLAVSRNTIGICATSAWQ